MKNLLSLFFSLSCLAASGPFPTPGGGSVPDPLTIGTINVTGQVNGNGAGLTNTPPRMTNYYSSSLYSNITYVFVTNCPTSYLNGLYQLYGSNNANGTGYQLTNVYVWRQTPGNTNWLTQNQVDNIVTYTPIGVVTLGYSTNAGDINYFNSGGLFPLIWADGNTFSIVGGLFRAYFLGQIPVSAPTDLPYYNSSQYTNSVTRFVDVGGSDGNDGFTERTAWQHLSYASYVCTNANGGTIKVAPGVYWNDPVFLSAQWNVIGSWPNTIISNLVDGASGGGITINNNTKVYGMRCFGGTLGGSGTNVYIGQTEVSALVDGLYTSSTRDMTIENCYFHSVYDGAVFSTLTGTNYFKNTLFEAVNYSYPLATATSCRAVNINANQNSATTTVFMVNCTLRSFNSNSFPQVGSSQNTCLRADGYAKIFSVGTVLDVPAPTNATYLNLASTASFNYGNAMTYGGFTGNGSGITNLQHAVIQTNFISGKSYVNSYGTTITVSTKASLGVAAVSGAANLSIRCDASPLNGGDTNMSAMSTIVTSLAMNYTNYVSLVIPTNANFSFTNLSTGAGNTATVVGGQITY